MRQRIGKPAGQARLVAAVGISALPGLALAAGGVAFPDQCDLPSDQHPRLADPRGGHSRHGARGHGHANRMSWGWCIGAILGIAIAFGAPQIVTWVRGIADSGRCRPLIPEHAGPAFRAMSGHHSGTCRHRV